MLFSRQACGLGPADVEALPCPNVRRLALCGNDLRGLRPEALRHLRLLHLDITACQLSEEECAAFVAAFPQADVRFATRGTHVFFDSSSDAEDD